MCGFIGILHEKSNFRVTALEHGFGEISKRGTSTDIKHFDGVSLGYARLPTDAVTSTSDNMINSKDGVTILFNGIITNVDDLCDIFKLTNNARRLDTECLREGFLEHGKAFLQRARGMFAITVVSSDSITMVRDTVGIKPLYYQHSADFLGFGSEIKGLLKAAPSQAVKEVLPGEIVTYDRKSGALSVDHFSYLSYKYQTKGDLTACLEEAILAPTLRYLHQTDKQVGILLSGGIDSSLLVYTLFTKLPADFHDRISVFTLGLEDSEDVEYARMVQAQLGIKVTFIEPWDEDATFQHMDDTIYSVESADPRVVKVALLQDVLARALEEREIQVLISGEGADELFFGYERFYDGIPFSKVSGFFEAFRMEVFPNTLLQRFDRQFARRCIEGRVPFLDQELIELSKLFTTAEKLTFTEETIINKRPLRRIAADSGLHPLVAWRTKMKMTKGVTKVENSEIEEKGYLEAAVRQRTTFSFREFCRLRLDHLFPNSDGKFPKQRQTEENLMQEVERERENLASFHIAS
ncbi:asparagine synthase-related protein [Pseudovibrio ascidiaceicola]|uniref:asparagine synthase-related protein n=1 Tax=Pseudovibrio ascidiaceicola TaxID=285279 RepID=UPI003D367CD7